MTCYGVEIEIDAVARVRPAGWNGDIKVYEDSKLNEFKVHWQVDCGSLILIASFSDESEANEFASLVKTQATVNAAQYQVYVYQAAMYQLQNKSFRSYENECDVPAELSGYAWSGAAQRISEGIIAAIG